MLYKLLSSCAVVLVTACLADSVYADEVAGKISKVGAEGRDITVKSKDGKEVAVKISGSRTTFDGVKNRSDLKERQSVTVEHEKGRSQKGEGNKVTRLSERKNSHMGVHDAPMRFMQA